MDLKTANTIYHMYQPRSYLSQEEERLLEESVNVLEINGLMDKDGNLIDED